MRTCLILKVVELFYNKDNFSSIISVLKRSLGLEAHCSGFCYFFLHKTSPWSFHSVTIDEEQKIFYNYISRFKNISDNVMTHKAKVVAFLRRISAKKHLTDFPHMTSIFTTF